MNLQRASYFVTLARTLSFSRTAEECCVTQATVSQQIKLLEQELGVQLFDRTKRSVRLTEAGRVFYEDARKILEIVSLAEDRMRTMAGEEHAALRILLANGIDGSYVIENLLLFRERHPNVRITCDYCAVPELTARLEGMQADVAYGYDIRQNLPAGIGRAPIRRVPQYVIVGNRHYLAQHTSLRREQLAGERFINAVESHSAFDLLEREGAAGTPDPGHLEFVGGIDALVMDVALSDGYTILAEPTLRRIAPNMNLAAVPLEGEDIGISLFYNTTGGNPIAARFIGDVTGGDIAERD